MRRASLIMAAALPALVGCQERSQMRDSNTWYGWKGTATLDPARDVNRLQGRWLPPEVEKTRQGRDVYQIVFDGDTVTSTLAADPPARVKDEVSSYRFVLNSGLDPKVIRYTHKLDDGVPLALSPEHGEFNKWYSLDGDTLTMWTIWWPYERSKSIYQRAK